VINKELVSGTACRQTVWQDESNCFFVDLAASSVAVKAGETETDCGVACWLSGSAHA